MKIYLRILKSENIYTARSCFMTTSEHKYFVHNAIAKTSYFLFFQNRIFIGKPGCFKYANMCQNGYKTPAKILTFNQGHYMSTFET